MDKDSRWHLGGEDFFQGLLRERRAFVALARRRELEKNDIVFFEEDPSASCYYLQTGLIKIFRITSSGKEPIFFLRRSGEMLGLAEVLGGEPRKANAQALAPSVLYEIGRESFEDFLASHFPAAKRAIEVLGRRLRYLGEQFGNLIACDVRARLIKLLITLAYDVLGDVAAWKRPVVIPHRVTQEQMAAMVGSCQQTVSELLKSFQAEGLLRMERRSITILDPLAFLHQAEK